MKRLSIATEKWECRFCGADYPCIIEIKYDESGPAKRKTRFRNKECLCNESIVTEWVQIDKNK